MCVRFLASILILFFLTSCKSDRKNTTFVDLDVKKDTTQVSSSSKKTNKESQKLTKAFKEYWYGGEAELTSYKLEQSRYGELRDGTAVLVYVTEDFLPKQQVKADNYNKANTPILKLNATKKFNTGIYPYSIMQSTFYPVANNQNAEKITASVQEWCGQTYTQLNNRNDFEIKQHSYFESEGDKDYQISRSLTENEIWCQLRINPKSLPVGEISIIPALEFCSLKHIAIKSYNAIAILGNDFYQIMYPELNRTLILKFNTEFPFDINSWEETFIDGYGINAKMMSTKATKIKTIKSDYWTKNKNSDLHLRTELGL